MLSDASVQFLVESAAYQNYLYVRDHVLKMKNLSNFASEGVSRPSQYWREELANFDYMIDASPLLISKLRHHTYHLTGLRVYDYRSTQERKKALFQEELNELKKLDKDNLLIPESPILGGFGYEIDGHLYNLDTIKFYECLIALAKSRILDSFRNTNSRKTVVEIGAGWGGFAYQFKSLCPNTVYFIIDFPEVFLFSAVYLMTAFKNARTLLVATESDEEELKNNYQAYDFVFIPQDRFNELGDVRTDLCINIVSFQEMTTRQVDSYAGALFNAGCRYFYSMNRERSPHNPELSTVSSVLSKYYRLEKIEVLGRSYLKIAPKRVLSPASLRRAVKHVLRKKSDSVHDYVHYVGYRKESLPPNE